ncbi:MAG: TMEM14 family protein [Verrucomicrobiales bacterium]|nr:TMEM14 family protein [Verrucomicrobiales bacterium]
MTPNLVLWVYIALLVAGGLVGYLKAGSKMSIMTSALFAGLLALSALGIFSLAIAMVLISFLAVFFGMRFVKGKKFMPAGLMTLLSVVALISLIALR